MPRPLTAIVLATTALLALATQLAACGGDNRRTLTVEAGGRSFTPDRLTLRQGEPVKLRLRNTDDEEHDLVVDGIDATIVGDGPNVDGAVTLRARGNRRDEVTFAPNLTGAYIFYCTVDNHREEGMEGVITVE